MNIRDIVREYLVTHGYDGLTGDADWDSCGCGVDDLMPCGDPNSRCQPARKVTWDTCPWRENGCPEWETAETCLGCYTIGERGHADE